MATIKARRQANGSIRYTAIVRKRVGTTIVHREAKTFTHYSAAVSWAKHREVAFENQAVPSRKQQEPATLAELIRWYIETFETISRWQRSKQSHLEFLERHAIGKANALDLRRTVSRASRESGDTRGSASVSVVALASYASCGPHSGVTTPEPAD
jgi:hypothetical protein